MTEQDAVRALAALAQPSRLQIFRQLIGVGPIGMTPTQLTEALGLTPSTLSFHLKELMHAGLVTQQRDGRRLIYRPALLHMAALLSFLTAHCCQGQPCLAPLAPPCSPAP